MKKYMLGKAVSMICISVITIVLVISNIAGISFPDVLFKILGAMEVISVFALVFTSVKIWKK